MPHEGKMRIRLLRKPGEGLQILPPWCRELSEDSHSRGFVYHLACSINPNIQTLVVPLISSFSTVRLFSLSLDCDHDYISTSLALLLTFFNILH